MNASSVNGDGSFIAHDVRDEVDAVEALVHVVGGVDDDAAGAEELGVHLVHVVAAEHGVARNQRHRGRALRQDVAQAIVVVLRRAEADQLALRPGAAPVHRRRRCRARTGTGREADASAQRVAVQSRGV